LGQIIKGNKHLEFKVPKAKQATQDLKVHQAQKAILAQLDLQDPRGRQDQLGQMEFLVPLAHKVHKDQQAKQARKVFREYKD
jgi:hypothetical protein